MDIMEREKLCEAVKEAVKEGLGDFAGAVQDAVEGINARRQAEIEAMSDEEIAMRNITWETHKRNGEPIVAAGLAIIKECGSEPEKLAVECEKIGRRFKTALVESDAQKRMVSAITVCYEHAQWLSGGSCDFGNVSVCLDSGRFKATVHGREYWHGYLDLAGVPDYVTASVYDKLHMVVAKALAEHQVLIERMEASK